MSKIFDQIEKYSIFSLISLYTVFVVANSSSPVPFSKLILLTFFATISVLAWSLRGYFKNTLSFARGKYDLAVIFLTIAYVASSIFRTPNKMEAFLIPGVTTFVVLSGLLYFIINQSGKAGKTLSRYALFISGILLSVSLVFTQIGLFNKIPQLSSLVRDPNFNPLGGPIPAIIYLFTVFLIGVVMLIKEKEIVKKALVAVSLGVILMGLSITVVNSLPGKPQSPRFPTAQSSWEIAVDTLKNSPLLGAGPGNYLTAFNLYRPVSYNQTDLWQVRFSTANNFVLTLITEVGLIGLVAFSLLIFAIYRSVSEDKFKNLDALPLVVFVILIFFLPVAPLLVFPLFVLMALNSNSENKGFEVQIPTKAPSAIVALFAISIISVFDFYVIKYASAEATFKKALESLALNDAKLTYETMQKAVNQNPQVDRYHASLAQVNMAIASSLAAKENVTDEERQTVTQLVQSAIAEGKNTVTLNSQRSGNWEVLAQIYRSIMPFAQGADQFAIQTYSQAVALDPTNPNLRISLGGVYYALGKYDEAIDSYKLATIAKPDLANAYYNLAIAYREKKDYNRAVEAINTVLNLVSKDSQDYVLAQNTLEDLKKNKPAGDSENLNAPEKLESSSIDPAIELSEDSNPPAGQ